MKATLLILLCLLSASAAKADTVLKVDGVADASAIKPVIGAFEKHYPNIHVEYREFETDDLYRRFRQDYAKQATTADVIISSAMDEQTKLVNDGYAQTYESPYAGELPGWAQWRDQAFGFTYEPVVMVYNKKAFTGRALPWTHEALARQLRRYPGFYRNRVGTYDVRQSGAGYLFATQDAVQSSTSARLIESLGRANVKTYCCTAKMLDEVAKGNLVLGYNLIGSYAISRAARDPRIGVIVPRDYALVMSRVAFISAKAKHVDAAHHFIDFLLSPAGQRFIARKSALIAIRPNMISANSASGIKLLYNSSFQPIKLGPGLLVYLDQMKKAHYMHEWKSMIQP